MATSDELFPSIGSIAEQTDLRPDQDSSTATTAEGGDDTPMQEIESLCMQCREQVSLLYA